MTEHKLLKYLRQRFDPPTGDDRLTPVILTDSKGRYLSYQCKTPFENSIKWWGESGRSSGQGLGWLRDNIEQKIGHLDNIHLYVWLGTCDLTEYIHPFIQLRPKTDELVQQLLNNFQEISKLLSGYTGCRTTFLEIPPYSIFEWNKQHKHTEPNKFLADDVALAKQIIEINNHIRYINSTLNVSTPSPSFTASVLHIINSKNTHERARDKYNFQLYKDGIHPSPNLARVWLRKISHLVKRDCW